MREHFLVRPLCFICLSDCLLIPQQPHAAEREPVVPPKMVETDHTHSFVSYRPVWKPEGWKKTLEAAGYAACSIR